MALSFERPWALLLWPALLLVLLALVWLRRPRSPLGLPLRLVMVTLLVLGLAGPTRAVDSSADGGRQVILVDRSASVGEAGLTQVQAALAAAGRTPADTLVVQFGGQPAAILNWSESWPALPPAAAQATDLAQALAFAGQLLAGQPGSVVLVSDGQATQGEALEAAEQLAQRGVRVDVWPVAGAALTSDVAVESVHMPPAVWPGEAFSLTVNLYALSPTTATLSVQRDGSDLADLHLELNAGENEIVLSVDAAAEGLAAFEAQVSAPGDERPQNDIGGTVGLVQPSPRVLIVASEAGPGQRLLGALDEHGIQAQIISPDQLPAEAADMLAYQVAALVDVPATALSFEQRAALEAFVHAQGRGVIFLGGPEAYSLGSYEGTPLEQMLPVLLEPPERTERPPASLLLIIDHSGSMTGRKLALAKEAAMRAVEILQPGDRVGVLAFNHEYEWRVPLAPLGSGAGVRAVLDRISGLASTGGTNMLTPLEVGLAEMRLQPEGTRHVVLLGDGVSALGEPADFQRIVSAGLDEGITVSTIAVGEGADRALMADIAEWGQGRFHVSVEPEDLPRLMLAETRAVRSEAVQRGTVQPQIELPHALVSYFSAADLPPLEAYVALSARPATEAEVVLVSPLGDPLLAAWQYGLGRVVAWSSDMGDVWSPAWESWSELGRFWTQAVRYALPSPSQEQVFAEAQANGARVTVNVLAAEDNGRALSLAQATLLLGAPDGLVSQVELRQQAPGEYGTTLTAPVPGAYRGLVTLEKDGRRWETPLGFVVSYSPEFSPRLPDGLSALRQLAEVTGGQQVNSLEPATYARAGATDGQENGLWLLLAALLFWPVEIAVRRRWMPWQASRR